MVVYGNEAVTSSQAMRAIHTSCNRDSVLGLAIGVLDICIPFTRYFYSLSVLGSFRAYLIFRVGTEGGNGSGRKGGSLWHLAFERVSDVLSVWADILLLVFCQH